jgi:hypothetical protein
MTEGSGLRGEIDKVTRDRTTQQAAQLEAERRVIARAARLSMATHLFRWVVIIGLIAAAYVYRKELARHIPAIKEPSTPDTIVNLKEKLPSKMKQTLDSAAERTSKDAEIVKRLQTK